MVPELEAELEIVNDCDVDADVLSLVDPDKDAEVESDDDTVVDFDLEADVESELVCVVDGEVTSQGNSIVSVRLPLAKIARLTIAFKEVAARLHCSSEVSPLPGSKSKAIILFSAGSPFSCRSIVLAQVKA